MIKSKRIGLRFFLFLFLIHSFLFGSLNFSNNYEKKIEVLNSFDVDGYYINDPYINKIKNSLLQKYKKRHFFKAMEEAYIYIPTIKKILAEYNIPETFLYMAMAESNFSNKAYSKKRAAGLWQFMPRTAKLFGLRIDDYVDERRDPIKSTKAAARYLSFLHKKFGKWYLAAIAYNCGDGKLRRAIKKAKSDELKVLLDGRKKYIPKESRMYIRKILALALLANDEELLIDSEYGYLLNRANAYSLATVKVASGDSLYRISKQIGIPYKELKSLNRHLKYNFIPPYKGGYEIYIPYIKLAEFRQKYNGNNVKKVYKVYTVKRGDSLYSIGKRYKLSYKVIKDFNHLRSNVLRLKQKLVIPVVKKSAVLAHHHSKRYYYVKKGDTLRSIARNFNVSISSLKSHNHLKSSIIRVGDKLKIYE